MNQDVITSLSREPVWKNEQEEILRKLADKASCFNIIHERCYKKYWCLNAWFNIPVIIISTVTGTGNFASQNLGQYAEMALFVIGGLNIFAGILATIATYTGVAQRLEGHRFSAVHWDKFARKVQIELAKPREDRLPIKSFIKQIVEEYDRLIEMSPIVSNDIIRWFKTTIKNNSMHEDMSECTTCINECFCFPCGCSCSSSSSIGDIIADDWKDISLPEIIGKVEKTIVVATVEEKHEVKIDDYKIYN